MNFAFKIRNNQGMKEILNGSAITFFLRILGMASGYVFSLLITRSYGANAWGMFSLTFTVFSFASILGTFGLDGAILRIIPELVVKNQLVFLNAIYRRILILSIFSSLIISIVLYGFSEWIAIGLFQNISLKLWIEYSALLIVPISICNINSQLLRGLKKIKEYVFLDMVARFLFPAIVFIIFKVCQIPINLVLCYFIGILIVVLLSFLNLYRVIKRLEIQTNQEVNSWNNNQSLIGLAYPLLFSSTLIFLKGWIDTIMLGHYRPEAEVGIYNIFLKVSIIATIPITAINSIGMPKIGELFAKKDMGGLESVLKFSAGIIFLSTFIITIVIVLFHNKLLNFFGKDFTGDRLTFYLLLIAQNISAFGGSTGYILQMTGLQKVYKNSVLLTLFITLTSNYLLIPILGIQGAAISTIITTLCYNIFLAISVKKNLKLNSTFLSVLNFK